jgi:hypothetical protein
VVDVSLRFEPPRLQRERNGAPLGTAIDLPPGVDVENVPTWIGVGWVVGYTAVDSTPPSANVTLVDCR